MGVKIELNLVHVAVESPLIGTFSLKFDENLVKACMKICNNYAPLEIISINYVTHARRLKHIGINFAIIISKLTIWVYTFLLGIHRYILFFWFWGLFTCCVYPRFFYKAINVLSGMFFYSYLGGMWKNLPIKYYVKSKNDWWEKAPPHTTWNASA